MGTPAIGPAHVWSMSLSLSLVLRSHMPPHLPHLTFAGSGGRLIRHAQAAAFPVGPLPVAVIEPSLPALLVSPVGGPPSWKKRRKASFCAAGKGTSSPGKDTYQGMALEHEDWKDRHGGRRGERTRLVYAASLILPCVLGVFDIYAGAPSLASATVADKAGVGIDGSPAASRRGLACPPRTAPLPI